MTKSPIERAIEIAGSESKLGAATGYSQVAINKAKHRGRVTAPMAVAIERVTGVQRHELCPGIFEIPSINAPCIPSPDSTAGRVDAASPDPTPETSQSLTTGGADGSVDAPANACG